MTRDPDTSWLMRHDAPRKGRARLRWPIKTTPPRCEGCRHEPPACICVKEEA